METLKYIPKLIKTVCSDIKNDNLIHYSFQYYSLFFLSVTYYLTTKYLQNPFYVLWFDLGILQLLDMFIQLDNKNPSREDQKILKRSFRFKIPLFMVVAIDWLLLIWSINEIVYTDKNLLYKAGVLFSNMLTQASSINVSHEINHKLNKWERMIGTFNLSKNMYMHFLIEHNEGHHKMVATPEDPATSKYNQTLFSFIFQSIIGGFKSAWSIESNRCQRVYGSKYNYHNRMIYFTGSYLLTPLALFCLFNFQVMIVHFLIALFSVIFLETINYIEHYGLERKRLPDGSFENVNITHSWNAPHRLSNYFLFKLQRHSDHHENALKPYQTLCTYEDSPFLPMSYGSCLLLANTPSVWFSVMNPLVDAYRKGSKPSEELLTQIKTKLLKLVVLMNLFWITLVIIQSKLAHN